jgi:UDP-3-O-[3-hydroxymyristoyl] glucosamine N-acyltransferase
MSKYQLTSLDRLQFRIYRKLVLFRGRIAGWRGATIGQRFGLEQGVEIYYPKCLKVGDDVTIGEYSYLHCLAERGVQIGNNTSIDRNLWLHCGGTLADCSHGFFKLGDRSYIGCNALM